MTRRPRWLMPVAMIALAVGPGCQSQESRAAEAAENTSQLAASAKQKQLWQDAADNGHAPGLDRVPIVQEPVEQRQRAQGGRSTPVPPQPVTIPPGVQNSIRIVDFPPDPGKSYEGPATVVDATGDRIQINLGAKRLLTVLARAGGKPIPVAAGDPVTVAYASRRGPRAQQRTVIGLLTMAGFGIVQTSEASDSPIGINVPLFNVNAQQLGGEPGSPVRIIAGPGVAPAILQPGAIVAVGDVTVFVVGSAGVGKGVDATLIEGKPYALNVMVWKVP